MPAPTILPTGVQSETFAGLTYKIEGELVPVLHVQLGQEPIYFEHHILLWKSPRVDVEIRPMSGGVKRLIAGMPLIMTQVRGPGEIAFSRDGAGHVFALHMHPGQTVDVREHQWLAATDSMDYTFTKVKGLANMLLSGTGFFIDTFHAQREGILWLHGYGNVFEMTLAPGEVIDVEPGGWIYKDQSVQMETVVQRLATSFFGGSGQLVFNRFTGPGRLAIQSMYCHFVSE